MGERYLDQVFDSIELLKDVGKSTRSILKVQAVLKQYKKGEHIFREKEPIHTIYFVVAGMAALYKISSLGEKKIIFVYGNGNLLNEVIFQELPASVSCEAQENAVVLCISRTSFLMAMERDFQLTQAVVESLSIKIRRLYRQLKNTSNSLRGDKKIVAKLWKLSNDYGVPHKNGTMIAMELSITYLADMIGSKRETVSRQVKMLVESGLITIDKNHFIIPDQEKLREYFKKE